MPTLDEDSQERHVQYAEAPYSQPAGPFRAGE